MGHKKGQGICCDRQRRMKDLILKLTPELEQELREYLFKTIRTRETQIMQLVLEELNNMRESFDCLAGVIKKVIK